MGKNRKSKFITPRSENYSEWYNSIVKMSGMAEDSAVRGCMVIKPYGYSIWEKIQSSLDQMLKDSGHSNAYFPLFVPKSFFAKEAQHVKGFAKECAVVTHYRLKEDSKRGVGVDPAAKLTEELIVRPTSETVIWRSYKNWIQSYRDLPLLINQWANVVRWEMRTRPFLRTSEFLWQEGHTAHATKQEAIDETLKILKIYNTLVEDVMGIATIQGIKTETERFAGAEETYCIETLMQDGKALQAGTSHFLGQNFARAFDVQFATKDEGLEYVWGTSWGVSTRLIGALIMSHGDDKGLVLPPNLAPIQVVFVPIYKSEEEKQAIQSRIEEWMQVAKQLGIACHFDQRTTQSPGFKFSEWEMKGVPIRIALGARDLENQTAEVYRRDTDTKEIISQDLIIEHIQKTLPIIQENMYQKSTSFLQWHTRRIDDYSEFQKYIANSSGLASCHWDGTAETEIKIKEDTKATIRCIPLDAAEEEGKCIFSGKPSKRRVLFAKAY